MKFFEVEWSTWGTRSVEAESKEQAMELFNEDPMSYIDIHDLLAAIKIESVEEEKLVVVKAVKHSMMCKRCTVSSKYEIYLRDSEYILRCGHCGHEVFKMSEYAMEAIQDD